MYLIIGANGYLGSYVIKNILEKTEDDIIATARDIATCEQNNRITWVKCEVTDKEDVDNLSELTAKNTEVKVVYLAAYHKPDMVQKNPKIAWNINITALSNMINQQIGRAHV